MNTAMITMSVKREYWEHKVMMFWVPLVMFALFVIAPSLTWLFADTGVFPKVLSEQFLQHFSQEIETTQEGMIARVAEGVIASFFMIFMVAAFFAQLSYFTNCLFSDRKDGSIIFWRSMPIGDHLNIGVKLLIGTIAIPACFLMCATVLVLAVTVLFSMLATFSSLMFDVSIWSFLAQSEILGSVGIMWLMVVPLALWLLPIYSWLMLASSAAKKAPFSCAFTPIVILLAVEHWLTNLELIDSSYFLNMFADYFGQLQGVGMEDESFDLWQILELSVSNVSIGAILLSMVFIAGAWACRKYLPDNN